MFRYLSSLARSLSGKPAGAYPPGAGQRKNRRHRGHHQHPEPGGCQSRRGSDQRDARLGAEGYRSPASGRPQDGGRGGGGGKAGLEEVELVGELIQWRNG